MKNSLCLMGNSISDFGCNTVDPINYVVRDEQNVAQSEISSCCHIHW